MGYDFALSNKTSLVHPVHDRTGATLSIDGHPIRAALTRGLADGEYFLDLEGERDRVFIATRADTHYIHWRGRAYRVDAINALERARRAAEPTGGAEIIRAPMPGTVVEVVAVAGSQVEAGSLLLTIESMKLQTAMTAAHPAEVAEVYVTAGATFDQGDPLIRLEESTDSTENGEDSP
jgi:biotin carboxyl carrier protein